MLLSNLSRVPNLCLISTCNSISEHWTPPQMSYSCHRPVKFHTILAWLSSLCWFHQGLREGLKITIKFAIMTREKDAWIQEIIIDKALQNILIICSDRHRFWNSHRLWVGVHWGTGTGWVSLTLVVPVPLVQVGGLPTKLKVVFECHHVLAILHGSYFLHNVRVHHIKVV